MTDPDRLNTQEQARLLQAADAHAEGGGPVRITAAGVTTCPARNRCAVGRLADAKLTNGGDGRPVAHGQRARRRARGAAAVARPG